ncbi:MAG: hypothetical protein CL823_00480 [Crocinitomicaceae bacterium]|nr:hypothetical protein [Crocinitomicaceae bacterium]|tara:strand:- start:2606 stop:3196 length:591 start_codon:yes stop_codon:yes gene_type:complete
MTRTPSITQTYILRQLQGLLKESSDKDVDFGGVLLSFAGPLNEGTINSLTTLTENSVIQCGAPRAELLRAKSVVKECLQNILKHGWIDAEGETLFYITLECSDKGLLLKCGSFIDNEMSDYLESKINEVNSWSTSDLRKRSVEILCKSESLEKDQPGLGLINIALNCKRPIVFSTINKSEKNNLFSIHLMVNHAMV